MVVFEVVILKLGFIENNKVDGCKGMYILLILF